MIAAGIDIGSTTTKVVLIDDANNIKAALVVPSGNLPGKTGEATFHEAMKQAGITKKDVSVITTTGYGRRLTDVGDIIVTEIKACGVGALQQAGAEAGIHTVIDVGGQDTKVISIDDDKEIDDFSMNDKCAAGTGRFLEMLAIKLGLSYEAFVNEALTSETMIQMNATCAVFAESEVVGLLARNVSKADIAAAAHNAIAARIASMTRRVGQRGAYFFVGGGARNKALVRAVQETLNKPVIVPDNSQITVALGAAIAGREKSLRHEKGDPA